MGLPAVSSQASPGLKDLGVGLSAALAPFFTNALLAMLATNAPQPTIHSRLVDMTIAKSLLRFRSLSVAPRMPPTDRLMPADVVPGVHSELALRGEPRGIVARAPEVVSQAAARGLLSRIE